MEAKTTPFEFIYQLNEIENIPLNGFLSVFASEYEKGDAAIADNEIVRKFVIPGNNFLGAKQALILGKEMLKIHLPEKILSQGLSLFLNHHFASDKEAQSWLSSVLVLLQEELSKRGVIYTDK